MASLGFPRHREVAHSGFPGSLEFSVGYLASRIRSRTARPTIQAALNGFTSVSSWTIPAAPPAPFRSGLARQSREIEMVTSREVKSRPVFSPMVTWTSLSTIPGPPARFVSAGLFFPRTVSDIVI